MISNKLLLNLLLATMTVTVIGTELLGSIANAEIPSAKQQQTHKKVE